MEPLSLHTQNLFKQLQKDIRNSSMIYILSSFIMRSGVEVIFDDLRYALQNGADIKVLTGDYLYVTQPEALKKLVFLEGDNIEIGLWKSDGISFHPKSFLFKHAEEGAFIVGSLNLSRSALTSGVEWNMRIRRDDSPMVFDQAVHSFISLFYHDKTMAINRETIPYYTTVYKDFHARHADLMKTWTRREEIELTLPIEEVSGPPKEVGEIVDYTIDIKLRPAQEEALIALEETVAEDYSKAMVVMATGLGKTYLAAFFAQNYKKVLFIAHHEKILKQAKESFEKVLNIPGGLYYGAEKDKPFLFASIFTLSIQEHLKKFAKDEFDLIVIDEFHHAAAKSYSKILNYFEP